MASFKSDSINAVSDYSYIPTGGIVTIAGQFSEYSDASYITLGLIPCDGRTLDVSINPQYSNLFSVIGILYGGTGSTLFLVPNLKTNKVAIAGTSATFHNVNIVGTQVNSIAHSHNTTATNNTFTLNNQNIAHNHSVAWNSVGANNTDTSHAHNFLSGSVGTVGPNIFYSGAAGATGGGLNGNHTHTSGITAANAITSGSTASHNHAATSSLAMGTNTASLHTHASSLTTTGVTSSTTYSSGNALGVPYANVLYFIKA